MEPEDLKVAQEFCKIVSASDLLEYLGLAKTANGEEALSALAEKRKRLQGMQSNPKYKESAMFLIKNYRALERVLAAPAAHLEHGRKAREDQRLPMFEMAIDSVLADGTITPQEESFLRDISARLEISPKRAAEVLRDRAQKAGINLARLRAPEPAKPSQGPVGNASFTSEASVERKLQGAAGHSWWDAHFTRMLLETIPSGPGEMVDVYCRTALSASTLLPERRQLSWVGVDRSAERLDQARELLADVDADASQLRLVQGDPTALPIDDESMDFVLAIRALANLADTRPVLAEAVRVLRPGGRVIVAEPDGMGETFYFDGHLAGYNEAFHQLCIRVDEAFGGAAELGAPGIALGPRLTGRMAHAGLRPASVQVHASNTLRLRTFGAFAKQLRKYPVAIARSAGLPDDTHELLSVLRAVDRLERSIPPERAGMCGGVLTMFLVTGMKD